MINTSRPYMNNVFDLSASRVRLARDGGYPYFFITAYQRGTTDPQNPHDLDSAVQVPAANLFVALKKDTPKAKVEKFKDSLLALVLDAHKSAKAERVGQRKPGLVTLPDGIIESDAPRVIGRLHAAERHINARRFISSEVTRLFTLYPGHSSELDLERFKARAGELGADAFYEKKKFPLVTPLDAPKLDPAIMGGSTRPKGDVVALAAGRGLERKEI